MNPARPARISSPPSPSLPRTRVHVRNYVATKGKEFSGNGTLTISAYILHLRVRPSLTLMGGWVNDQIPFHRITNVQFVDRTVSFDRALIATRQHIEMHFASAEQAAHIASLLPSDSKPDTAALPLHQSLPTFRSPASGRWPFPYVTAAIIAANAAVFIAMVLNKIDYSNPDPRALLPWGADYWPLTTSGQWWRLLTSTFLHFGIVHLTFNMLALVQVGRICERLFGRSIYAAGYIFCGIVASIISIWLKPHAISIGASGAIFGVYGMLLAYLALRYDQFPRAVAIPLIAGTIIFIGYNIYMGFQSPIVDNPAHFAGLVCGIVLGLTCTRPILPNMHSRPFWQRAFSMTSLAVVIIAPMLFVIPKSNAHPRHESALVREWQSFLIEDEKCLDAQDKFVKEIIAGQAPSPNLIQKLNQDQLALNKIRDALANCKLDTNSPIALWRDRFSGYVAIRCHAVHLCIESIPTNNKQKLQFVNFVDSQARVLAANLENAVANIPD